MVMGSATAEDSFQKKVKVFLTESQQMQRPTFYPCTDCGRKFTRRALEVHKQSCSETENCQCMVCKISKTKVLFKEDYILLDTTQSTSKKLKTDTLFMNENFRDLWKTSFKIANSPNGGNDCKMKSPVTSVNISFVKQQMYACPENPSSSNSSVENEITSLTETASADNQHDKTAVSSDEKQVTATPINEKNENISSINEKSDKILTTEIKSGDLLAIDDNSKHILRIGEDKEIVLRIDEKNDSSLDSDNKNEVVQTKDDKNNKFLTASNSPEFMETLHDGLPCNRKLFCIICKKHIFWERFGSHALEHTILINNNRLRCPLCSDSRSSPTYFLMHFYSHITSHPSDCAECRCEHPKCLEVDLAPLSEHCYAESLDHRCYICLKYFSHFQTLVNHMRLHSKEMPFSCTECPRSFRQIGNLQRHMTTHRGERPHKCIKCSRSFADPATLRNHVRVHTKETPYICSTCNRGFSQVGNLKRHMALHVQKKAQDVYVKIVGDQKGILVREIIEYGDDTTPAELEPVLPQHSISNVPNEVDEVSEGSSDAAASSSASEVNAGGKSSRNGGKRRKKSENFDLHVCCECGKRYTWKHDLEIHFRTHTGEKPYRCDICDKRFAQSGAVRIHRIRHHATAAQIRERMNKGLIRGELKATQKYGC